MCCIRTGYDTKKQEERSRFNTKYTLYNDVMATNHKAKKNSNYSIFLLVYLPFSRDGGREAGQLGRPTILLAAHRSAGRSITGLLPHFAGSAAPCSLSSPFSGITPVGRRMTHMGIFFFFFFFFFF